MPTQRYEQDRIAQKSHEASRQPQLQPAATAVNPGEGRGSGFQRCHSVLLEVSGFQEKLQGVQRNIVKLTYREKR